MVQWNHLDLAELPTSWGEWNVPVDQNEYLFEVKLKWIQLMSEQQICNTGPEYEQIIHLDMK